MQATVVTFNGVRYVRARAVESEVVRLRRAAERLAVYPHDHPGGEGLRAAKEHLAKSIEYLAEASKAEG